MDSPFPLLRLPQVALAEVLSLLEPKWQLCFAFCSKKAENIFKRLRYKRLMPKIEIEGFDGILHASDFTGVLSFCWFIDFSVSAYPWGGDIIEVKLGKHQAVLHISRKPFCFLTMHWTGHFDYYWEHMGTGMKVLADYILDLLGVGIYVLNMITRPQQLVDLYEEKPIEIIAFGGKDTNFSAEDLSYVLTKAKAKHFLIYTWPNDFELNESHRTHFELLVVTGAHHLKIEHLMGFDCIEIRIRDKWFSNEELNRFLMHWINVGNPRLRCFIADIKDFDGEQALKDIKVQKTKKKMSTYKSLSIELQFENQEIQRNDGVTASIKYFPETKTFSFAVWPDTPNRSHLFKTINYLLQTD